MDGKRFDSFSRSLAMASDRRSVLRGAAGGGFLAMLGMLIGRKGRSAVAASPITCQWDIEAHGSVGPNDFASYNGILTVTIETNGEINRGTYVLVDSSWNPLTDSHGDPIGFDVVGSTHLRSIDFRTERDGCEPLDFHGVNRFDVTQCEGPMSGSFHGPELVDLGGWRTRRTEICSACRGMTCPAKTMLDSASCTCVPQCPGGSVVCKDLTCVPAECPSGTIYDETLCECICEPKTCKTTEIWCPFVCECLPPKPCTEHKCPPGYVHYLLGEETCICIDQPCVNQVVCAAGDVLVYDGETCKCIGKCKEETCEAGYSWDKNVCGCVPGCKKTTCPQGETWDDKTCSCITECIKHDCDPGTVWSDAQCGCVPQGCPPVQCPNDNYTIDPNSCQCVCQQQTCTGNLKWDQDKCVCYCKQLTCETNEKFNSDTCSCEPSTCQKQDCPAREEWDQDLCKCVCATEQCSTGFTWSTDSCTCVCALTSCDDGETLNIDQCVCLPNNPCANSPACADGMTQDPKTCECLCPDGSPICDATCTDEKSGNCGACGNTCKNGCCQGLCCVG